MKNVLSGSVSDKGIICNERADKEVSAVVVVGMEGKREGTVAIATVSHVSSAALFCF